MNALGHTSKLQSATAHRRSGAGNCARVVLLALSAVLGVTPQVRADALEGDVFVPANEDPGYIEAYLSDQRRVGSLAGSILGSALIAHPAGTVVGSVLGFVLGSQVMLENDEEHDVPRESGATDTLALASPDSSGTSARSGPLDEGRAASQAANAMPVTPPGTVSSYPVPPGAAHPAAPQSREQIMQICALGLPADQRLRAMCYYFQGR